MSSRSGFKVLIAASFLNLRDFRDKPRLRGEQAASRRPAARLLRRAAVNSSAGKNVSIAISESVTSIGVPKIMVADMKLSTSPPNRSFKGIATLSGGKGPDRAGME